MDNQKVLEQVRMVTGRVLGIDPNEIKPSDNFIFDLGAESMQSVELVMGFEAQFGINMDQEKALAVQSVQEAADYIAKQL